MSRLTRLSLGIAVAVLLYAFARCGIWLESQMKVVTPLYHTVNSVMAAILSVIVGFYVAFYEGEQT